MTISITGALADQGTTDQLPISAFGGVTIADTGAGQIETVTVALSAAANGMLSNLDGGSYDAATGVYTVSGTADAVTAALDGLVFTPTPGQVAAGQSVTTDFTIVATDTAGASATDRTATVTAAPQVPPTITGVPTTIVADNNTSYLLPYGSITVLDGNFGQTDTVTISLSSTANNAGLFVPTGVGSYSFGGSYDAATGVYTVSGTDVEVQLALRQLEFFEPAGVTDTLTFTDTDTDGASTTITTTVTNTAPPPPATITITGAVSGQTVADTGSIAPFTGVGIADSNTGGFLALPVSQTLTVMLSAAANGTLSNLDGGNYDAASGVYTVSGSVADVNAALDGLVFTPTAGQDVTTTFTITDAETGTADSATDSTTTVTAAHIQPLAISGTVADQSVSDFGSIAPFGGVTIADPNDGQTETVTVTLSSTADGTLSNLGGGSYDAGTGVYTVTGSAGAVTAAVDGLVFTPTAEEVAPGQSVTTTFTLQDTDTLGASASDDTTSVVTTDVDMGITGAVAQQATTDHAVIAPFTGMAIVDVNAGATETVTVTLSAAANGALSNLGGGSYDAATGVYTDAGSAAAVSADLDGLLFTPSYQQAAAGQTVSTSFTIAATDSLGHSAADSTITVAATAAVLDTLVTFDGANGALPQTTLLIDAAGNLYGETTQGGSGGLGTIFELTKRGGVYASTPGPLSTGSAVVNTNDGLVSGTGEVVPGGSALFMDAAGSVIFSTISKLGGIGFSTSIQLLGANDVGPLLLAGGNLPTVPTSAPRVTLMTGDDMFVANAGGQSPALAVYAGLNADDFSASTLPLTETVLPVFNVTGPMAVDADGNVFGTIGGAGGGSVFELKQSDNFESPVTLASFDGANGADPEAGLIADAAGNLFGTTYSGGADNDGTVFELVKNGSSYTLVTLASFDSVDGANPDGALIEDSAGNLFGTTLAGGADGDGTVFEIANTGGAYAGTPTTLLTFDGANGSAPQSGLTADAGGNLFGTTSAGGANNQGTLFELSNVGFVTEAVACYCRGTLILTERGEVPVEDLAIGDKVMTATRAPRPIKWIGRRSYGGRFVIGRKDILPICIKAGALADHLPRRDLWISPHHAMYLEGVLIEARDLVNGLSIVQAEHVETVEYFHIELDRHDVIIAEGAASESFVDDDSRGMFHNEPDYRALYPGAAVAASAQYCAPRLDDGYQVEAVRLRISLRAGLSSSASDRSGSVARLRGSHQRGARGRLGPGHRASGSAGVPRRVCRRRTHRSGSGQPLSRRSQAGRLGQRPPQLCIHAAGRCGADVATGGGAPFARQHEIGQFRCCGGNRSKAASTILRPCPRGRTITGLRSTATMSSSRPSTKLPNATMKFISAARSAGG